MKALSLLFGLLALGALAAPNPAPELDSHLQQIEKLLHQRQRREADSTTIDAKIRTLVKKFRDAEAAKSKVTDKNLIQPGDTLDVQVKNDATLSSIYLVRRGGYILVRNVGRIPVAGKSLDDARTAIHQKLFFDAIGDHPLTVGFGQHDPGVGTIFLAGQCKNPGPWLIPPGFQPTVVTTLLRSGGIGPTADLTQVYIIRENENQPAVQVFNIQAVLDGKPLAADSPLNPGDIIFLLPSVPHSKNIASLPKILPDDNLEAYRAIQQRKANPAPPPKL